MAREYTVVCEVVTPMVLPPPEEQALQLMEECTRLAEDGWELSSTAATEARLYMFFARSRPKNGRRKAR